MRVIQKIIKIIQYIPILWRDEDWDYEYLLALITYKLKRMKKAFIANSIVETNKLKDIISGIDSTVKHIENYCDVDGKSFDTVYGKSLDNLQINRDFTKEESDEFFKYSVEKFNFENSEWDNIWNTIKEEGRKWWD